MMFRFHGSSGLSECGGNTHVHFSVSCNMGPEANALQSALRISSWLSWNVASCLCLSSIQQFSPFPVRVITSNRPGNAESEGVGFVVCPIASKCIQQYSYKEKSYSPKYHRTGIRIGLWNTFIGRRRHFFSEWMVTMTMTDGITHTNFTQWPKIQTIGLLLPTGLQRVWVD